MTEQKNKDKTRKKKLKKIGEFNMKHGLFHQ